MGGHIDSPLAGSPPSPWDVDIHPPEKFQNHTSSTQVPHTESIKVCHSCGGVGRKRCYTCTGSGWVITLIDMLYLKGLTYCITVSFVPWLIFQETCYSCQGDGYKPHPLIPGENEKCYQCNQSGKRRCWKCNGECMMHCRGCSGTGQIKCFIKVTASWTNHQDDHVVDKGPIPDERIKLVSGEVVFEEQHTRVSWEWPWNEWANDSTIDMANKSLSGDHDQFGQCAIGSKAFWFVLWRWEANSSGLLLNTVYKWLGLIDFQFFNCRDKESEWYQSALCTTSGRTSHDHSAYLALNAKFMHQTTHRTVALAVTFCDRVNGDQTKLPANRLDWRLKR